MKTIKLPKPKQWDGTVYDALSGRKTIREISPKELPLEILSGLLWAANGVNRQKGPFGAQGRTAASASNSREIDIYAAMKDGVYLYEPELHRLAPAVEGDLRRLAIGPGQNMGNDAPARLIYVADLDKFSKAGFQEPGLYDPEIRKSYYYADTGLAAGNVYLYAASRGLAAWFHNCDRAALPKALKLGPSQLPLFGQSVGYPL